MSKRYVLGIDSGTSVVKVLLTDLEGNELGVSVEATPVESPHPGWSEFDLDADWASVCRAIRNLLEQHRLDPGEILAVGVTGKGWGACYLDRDGRPARKGILWNDARSAEYIDRWSREGILSRIYQINGSYYYSGDCGPITRWLLDHEPETAARTATVTFPPGAIVHRLTGKIKLAHGDPASLCDVRKKEYSAEIFDLIGISQMRDRFAATSSSRQIAGVVTQAASEATGLKAGTPVVLAEFDANTCTIGQGVTRDGEIGIIMGTAHVITVCQADLVLGPDPGSLAVMMPYMDDLYAKLTGPFIATPNLDWYLSTFGEADRTAAAQAGLDVYTYLDQQLKQIPAGSDGIIYHPYLHPGGERGPVRMPHAKGNVFGLGMQHTRHHVLRSLYEGVVFSALDCILAAKVSPREIAVSGGASKSDTWCQIEADIMGCTVKVPAGTEHTARGAIITTLVAMGVYPDYAAAVARIVRPRRTYQPDADNHRVYRQLFDIYRAIRTHLLPDWEQRAAVLASLAPESVH